MTGLIEAQWVRLANTMNLEVIPAWQLRDMRLLFYMGAMAVLHLTEGVTEGGTERVRAQLADEMLAFTLDATAGGEPQ